MSKDSYAQISNFVKIRPAGAQLIYARSRTEALMEGNRNDKAVADLNFAKAPKNLIFPYGGDYSKLLNIVFLPLKLERVGLPLHNVKTRHNNDCLR
jgi:hypothetical protein